MVNAFLSKEVDSTFEYLCEKFIFYTKINSANMFHPDIILVLNLGAINDQTNLSPYGRHISHDRLGYSTVTNNYHNISSNKQQ